MRFAPLLAAMALCACSHAASDALDSNDDAAPALTSKGGAGVLPSSLPPAVTPSRASGSSRGTPLRTAPRPAAVTAPKLAWHGGKIIASAKVYNLYWGTQFEDGGAEAAERARYDAFAAAMDGSWDLVKPLNQYGIGPISYLGSKVFVPDPPASLDDRDLRATVSWAITNGYVPAPDSSTLYQVFLPAGTALTKGTEAMCKDFCGYHGSYDDPSINGGASIRYVALPRPDCAGCSYAATVQDRVTVIDSHELSEAVTDPDVNNHLLGWYDDANGEVGDICAHAPTSSVKGFAVQAEWSNQDDACVGPKDAVPDFSVALGAPSIQVQRGSSATVRVWASPQNGYSATTTFAAQAPVGIEAALPYASLPANTYQDATLSVDDGLDAGLYTVTFTLSDGKLTHAGALAVQVVEPPHPRTALLADAEQGLQGWQTATIKGQPWRIELSTASASGTHRFRSNVPQGYSASTSSFLISPAFVLTGASTATVTFAWKAQLEQGYDWLSIYATADEGAHWDRLKDVTGQSAGFPGWAPMALDLSAYAGKAGVRIAFGLQSDSSVQGWGVALDDVQVLAR